MCIFNKAWEWLVTCTSTILDIKTFIEHFETITRKHTRPKAVYVAVIKLTFNVYINLLRVTEQGLEILNAKIV